MVRGTLVDIIALLDEHDEEWTIYAAEPWCEDSAAVVVLCPDSNVVQPIAAPGLTYFLEVFIAREFLEDYESSLDAPSTLSQRCARLIQYATFDA
jgi:hypothetical protein